MELVTFETSDGQRLVGDLRPSTTDGEPLGTVVVCHPHPQMGGDRHNPVVQALFDALPPRGFHTLRFDFRAAFGGGTAERLDVVAALDVLTDRFGSLPSWTAGYSFGAAVTLATTDPRPLGTVAVAAPLSMMAVDDDPGRPVLLLVPEHDQFCSPADAERASATWADRELRTVPSTDHFLAGGLRTVTDATGEWLLSRSPTPRV